jgi:hypothetical protein
MSTADASAAGGAAEEAGAAEQAMAENNASDTYFASGMAD